MATWNSRGLRGSTLEDLVNRTNEQYREKDWHLSRKFPLRSHLSVWIRKTVILRWHISSNEAL